MTPRIDISMDRIREFCQRWRVQELALFGSVLREDFSPDSDVDVLVTFAPDYQWGWGELAEMLDALKAIFGREVDLVEKDAVTNPFRRREILRTAQVVYVA